MGLRGYGQKDPLIEYKNEGYDMFLEFLVCHDDPGAPQRDLFDVHVPAPARTGAGRRSKAVV